jgi:hypothetical protein
MHNFRDMAAQFDAAEAWARVADAASLAATWRRWLDDPAAAAAIGARAARLVDENRGALARTLAAIAPALVPALTGLAVESDGQATRAPRVDAAAGGPSSAAGVDTAPRAVAR